jgi:hypothetical protein
MTGLRTIGSSLLGLPSLMARSMALAVLATFFSVASPYVSSLCPHAPASTGRAEWKANDQGRTWFVSIKQILVAVGTFQRLWALGFW